MLKPVHTSAVERTARDLDVHNLRATALDAAIRCSPDESAQVIVQRAEAFLRFLQGRT